MKLLKIILFFLLISCTSKHKKTEVKHDISKEVMTDICSAISSTSFSFENATDYDISTIEKFIEDEMKKIESSKKRQLKNSLHSKCPSFNEFINLVNSKKDIYKIWDAFVTKETNTTSWNITDRDEYLNLCNWALSSKNKEASACECVLNEISLKFSSEEFNNLSIDEQGHLSGMIKYAYCN